MAVVGIFAADFSAFYDAVQKAEVQLRSFESGSARVEKQLDRMTDSFSGRKIIADATLMAEVFDRMGGAAKFTEAELARMGAVGAEAIAKMKATGIGVPEQIQRMADATKDANRPAENLHSTYQKFDGVLQAAGVNIGAQVKGLTDMTAAGAAGASAIGSLATAGLVLGTAMAAWKIGRAIAEFTGLDQAIAGANEKLLKAQEHAARMDVLAIASERAGRKILDFAEAQKVNKEFTEAAVIGFVDYEAQLAAAGAQLDKFSADELEGIELAKKMGASQAQLQLHYGLTSDAVALVSDRLSKLNEEDKKSEAAAKKHAEALEELSFAGDGWKGTLDALNDKLVESIGNYLKAGVSQAALAEAYGLTAQQVKAVAISLDQEKEAAKHAESALAQVTKLRAENTALEISMSGTARDAKIADINAEMQAALAGLIRKKELTAGAESELERQRSLKISREMADFNLINSTSRTSLDQRAEYEYQTYLEMAARHGEFSADVLAKQKERYLDAQDRSRNWRQVQAEEFDEGTKDVQKYKSDWERAYETMGESVDATLKRVTTLNERVSQSFSFDLKPLTGYALDDVKARFHQAGDRDDDTALWRALKTLEGMEGRYAPKTNEQFFTMQRDQILLAQLRMMLGGKDRPPGFAGGVENFGGGLAYVHKDELLVNLPKGTSVIPAGRSSGGRTINLTVQMYGAGNRNDGQRVGKQIIDLLRAQGELLPTGA